MKRLLPRSEFSRNVVKLMTGTTIAQAIPMAISPILTRLYTPRDFGVFALFVSVTSIFSAIANGRYELAIMLPQEDEDALNIAALSLFIATCLSFCLLLAVVFGNDVIANLLGSDDIGPWLYLAPLTVLFAGFFNVLNYYSSRQKRFGDIARAAVVKAVVLATVQLGFGIFKAGAGGLVAGQVTASMAANLRLLERSLRGRSLRHLINRSSIRRNARRYLDFPKFSLPAVFANALSNNIGSILISRFYSVATLGQYALVQRILGIPAALVGNSIGQVFYQQAAEEIRMSGSARKSFQATLIKLIVIAMPVFLIAYLLVEDAFALVFGEPWREAGLFAQILVPLFAVRFVVSPLSATNQASLNNKVGMYGNLVLLALSGGVIWVCGAMGVAVIHMLQVLTVASGAFYVLFLYATYRFSSKT